MASTHKALQKKSKAFLKFVSGKAGVYIVSPINYYDEIHKDPSERFRVKIGLAGTSKMGNLVGRFNQYLLCWPSGFYVFGIIFTSNKQNAKKTEKSIHRYLNTKELHIVTNHSHDEEWFELTKHEIDRMLALVGANQDTRVPDPFPAEPSIAGQRVFPFSSIPNLQQFAMKASEPVRVDANLEIGQARIRPMHQELKRTLDTNNVNLPNISTGLKKPRKTTRKRPGRV